MPGSDKYAACYYDLDIPVGDWGSEVNYAHPLKIGSGQQQQSLLAWVAVPESVWVVSNNGGYYPEVPGVISVVDPGVSPGYVRIKARDNSSLYSSLGITATGYRVRLYVQASRSIFGAVTQPADPSLVAAPIWSLSSGPPSNENTGIAGRWDTTETDYYVVGSIPFDPANFSGKTVYFAAIAAQLGLQVTGYVQLYNLSNSSAVTTFSVTGSSPTIYRSAALSLPSGEKIYEVRIKSGSGTNSLILYGAQLEMR